MLVVIAVIFPAQPDKIRIIFTLYIGLIFCKLLDLVLSTSVIF